MARRHNDLSKLRRAISLLTAQQPLPSHYRDHGLIGELSQWRDLHLEPD